MPMHENFIAVAYYDTDAEEAKPCKEGEFFKNNKLKFHIGLPENDEPMFEKGWNITKDILMNNNVGFFKIINKGLKMSDQIGQEGKDITIYAYYDPDKDLAKWQSILQTINQHLIDAKIPPGKKPSGIKKEERPISGSSYITYRYDIKSWPPEDLCAKITVNQNLADDNKPEGTGFSAALRL